MQINKPENTLQNISVGNKEINAARVAFFLPGFVISTWAPMIPMVKARLNLEADVLGLLLLCIGISAFIFMPLAGALVQRYGCKKVVIEAEKTCAGKTADTPKGMHTAKQSATGKLFHNNGIGVHADIRCAHNCPEESKRNGIAPDVWQARKQHGN